MEDTQQQEDGIGQGEGAVVGGRKPAREQHVEQKVRAGEEALVEDRE